uniref:DUF4199 domain-containing protein n=1 Tax=Cephaloticoccus sp. TaxID=1985742 RepID=UPI00404A3255
MKISITYGFFITLASSLLSLGFFFTGYHDEVAKLETAQNIGMGLGVAIAIVCMLMGMKEKRELTPADGKWGYGPALGTGVLIGLFGAIFSSIYTYCYFTFINPNMGELIFQMQVLKMEAKGMTDTQIAQAEPMIRKMMSPVLLTVVSTFTIFIMNVVLALITAIFAKNRPTVEAEPTA